MSGFNERFEVSCQKCGGLSYYRKLNDAVQYAFDKQRHHIECGYVVVFDRMAHLGQPELYSSEGLVTSIRKH
jgi:hypothetical protein